MYLMCDQKLTNSQLSLRIHAMSK